MAPSSLLRAKSKQNRRHDDLQGIQRRVITLKPTPKTCLKGNVPGADQRMPFVTQMSSNLVPPAMLKASPLTKALSYDYDDEISRKHKQQHDHRWIYCEPEPLSHLSEMNNSSCFHGFCSKNKVKWVRGSYYIPCISCIRYSKVHGFIGVCHPRLEITSSLPV